MLHSQCGLARKLPYLCLYVYGFFFFATVFRPKNAFFGLEVDSNQNSVNLGLISAIHTAFRQSFKKWPVLLTCHVEEEVGYRVASASEKKAKDNLSCDVLKCWCCQIGGQPHFIFFFI